MKISVSIPLYDAKLQMQSVAALLTESTLAALTGDLLTVNFLPSCTNLAMGRNQLVKEFLASDFDRLVFLDADVTFQAGSLLRLAHHKEEFVGGTYRLKQQEENYPVGWIPGSVWERDLIEVAMVPTGFLALSRSVFDKFKEAYQNREYTIGGNESYCYFQIPYARGHLYTEDAYFCEEWRKMGGKIFLDPDLTLTHWNQNIPYVGNIGRWLSSRIKETA